LATKATKLKPLRTVDRADLIEMDATLRELTSKLASAADMATDPSALPNEGDDEYDQARLAFNRQRILNYLATTWNQLESVAPNSAEFTATLENMLSDVSQRLEEVESLAAKLALGDSGWRVASFDLTPALFQGLEELQGWTANFSFVSPSGERVDTTLFSELPERNRYPESGRVYGALWLKDSGGGDTSYGRQWDEDLDKPRLEIMQSRNGELQYRYSASDFFSSGQIETSTLDESSETLKGTLVNIATAAGESDTDELTSFTLESFALQDEIGARIMPTSFVKDNATEFYGKLKLRVTLDETSETFWLRTLPLESVTPEQIPFFSRTFASKSRRAKITLSDREIDLGVALYVKTFTPVYEPGSSTPASFASLTRTLPTGLDRETTVEMIESEPEKDVLIEMNRPGVLKAPGSSKRFWAYQDSFRGPYKPGDKEFDDVVQGKLLPGEEVPRDALYYTIISLNDDPGRGLKYIACLLIVWGTALLVYRGRKTKPVVVESNANAKAMRAGQGSLTILVALCAVAAILATAAQFARGDEIQESSPIPVRNEIDWNAWRSLPVFDDGRLMPLNTFAQIMVRDVTGSNAPTLSAPPEILERLESGEAQNFPTLNEFLNDLNAARPSGEELPDEEVERQKAWYQDVAAQTIERQEDVAQRIRAAFPGGRQKFGAAELLFSWFAEPELWESIPFILDEGNLVARNVFKFSAEKIVGRGGRLAPDDFDALEHGSVRTLAEAYRAKPDADPETLKTLRKAELRLAAWRSVVFTPTQGASTRPRACLEKILYGGMPSAMPSAHGMKASPTMRLDGASKRLESLLSREARALREESPLYDQDHLLRQRTSLGAEGSAEILTLSRQIAVLAEVYRRYPLSSTGVLFAKLYDATTRTLDELREHRDAIMKEQTYSLEYRQALGEAVSALDEIVGELEQASLALTTEEPKTLCVAPIMSKRAFKTTEAQIAPWVSLQSILWAPDPIYVQFVDPASGVGETPTSIPTDKEKITPFDDMLEALEKSRANRDLARPEVDAFIDAVKAYRDRDGENRGGRVTAALERFASALRELADRNAEARETLAKETNHDEVAVAHALEKTRYPDPTLLDAEIFYYDLNAFFWNWVACLAASIAFFLSYLRQGFRALRKKSLERGEWFFFTLGLLCLVAGCAVALLGGAVRSYITGWAPVANMFETVVLLAFSIATIAIFYTLAPIWRIPFLNAWRSAAFWGAESVETPKGRRTLVRAARALLTLAVLVGGVKLWTWYRGIESSDFTTMYHKALESLTMQGFLDAFAVLATFLFIVWLAPRFIAALVALLLMPRTLCRRDDVVVKEGGGVGAALFAQVAERRAFLTASAVVAALVAAAAYFNSSEFNPHIRPLVAVLRSNFWLTIHVVAIIISYALGAIAWVVSLTSLAYYIFGRYASDPECRKLDPEYCVRVTPVIAMMIRSAVLFLTAGIILGARWADFSWGRFWSWDPKEVWALVTLLVYLVVLHANRLSGRNRFVLSFGATFGALAIIMTWYGLSFVMGGGGRHAYTGGESNKVAVLYALFAANILWALAAAVRYSFQRTILKARRRARETLK
jgi:ABC-type transport system involved in cytochrome c biogenesis permease subunit